MAQQVAMTILLIMGHYYKVIFKITNIIIEKSWYTLFNLKVCSKLYF